MQNLIQNWHLRAEYAALNCSKWPNSRRIQLFSTQYFSLPVQCSPGPQLAHFHLTAYSQLSAFSYVHVLFVVKDLAQRVSQNKIETVCESVHILMIYCVAAPNWPSVQRLKQCAEFVQKWQKRCLDQQKHCTEFLKLWHKIPPTQQRADGW